MKAIPIEELETISPSVYAEAVKVGCTHARVSEPIWRGPATRGPEGEEMRMVEFSWFKAILLRDTVIFDETDPKRFLTVLAEYGLGDVESMQPMREHGDKVAPVEAGSPGHQAPDIATPAPNLPERQALTVYVLAATKAKMEAEANQSGLSLGALID